MKLKVVNKEYSGIEHYCTGCIGSSSDEKCGEVTELANEQGLISCVQSKDKGRIIYEEDKE